MPPHWSFPGCPPPITFPFQSPEGHISANQEEDKHHELGFLIDIPSANHSISSTESQVEVQVTERETSPEPVHDAIRDYMPINFRGSAIDASRFKKDDSATEYEDIRP